jgi:hypothetical protein
VKRGQPTLALLLAVVGLALAVRVAAGAADPYAPPPRQPPPAPPQVPAPGVQRFSHVHHAAFTRVDVKQCSLCHALGADLRPLTPGSDGHQPCMSSGCHMQDFLDPDTKLCLGCHATSDNYRKNPALDVFYADPSPEHHVEVDHAAHMKRGQPGAPTAKATCETCHWVDKTSYQAVTHPGHAQCAPCHAQGQAAARKPMTDCNACHPGGSPDTVFTRKRRDPELNHRFLHERANHRYFDPDKKTRPMQCDLCHSKVGKLTSLADVFAVSLVDTATMRGTCARCHDVADTKLCTKCHRQGTIIKTFNYHVLQAPTP